MLPNATEFLVGKYIYQSTPVTADPSSLVSVTADLGIGTVEKFYAGGYVFVVWHVNQVVAAGRYTAGVKGIAPITSWDGQVGSGVGYGNYPVNTFDHPVSISAFALGPAVLGSAPLNSISASPQPGGPWRYGKDYSTASVVAGVHNSKAVKMIEVGQWSGALISCNQICTNPTNVALANGEYFFTGTSAAPSTMTIAVNPAYTYTFIHVDNGSGTFVSISGLNDGVSSEVVITGYGGPVNLYLGAGWGTDPFPQPTFGTEYYGSTNGVPNTTPPPATPGSYSATVPGYWRALTGPLANINPAPASAMPWNITFQRGGVSEGIGAGSDDFGAGDEGIGAGDLSTIIASILCNPLIGVPAAIGSNSFPRLSYDHSLPLEEQYEPPRWKASCWFDVGNTIWDSNGNVQTCTTAGLTGLTEPAWSVSLNAALVETVAAPATAVAWQLTQKVNTGLPETWESLGFYERGDTVQDANGNTQTAESWLPTEVCSLSDYTSICTDSNNNTQQLITAGTTGPTEPVWNTVLNGLTNDGTCVWKLVYQGSSLYSGAVDPVWSKTPGAITNDFMVNWKLTAANPGKMVTPAMHRQLLNTGALQSQPKYPAYWFSETIARLMPPGGATDTERTVFGTGSQWLQFQTSNAMDGCWIYSVALNRLGTPGAVSLPQSGQVAVTLGCMRNGSFVAFGTYNTGQKINVLWPIFTSDALVYQCSERVDVQALAIQDVDSGWGVTHPLCAAHILDTIALLDLIS
jgi:hypothetical protein